MEGKLHIYHPKRGLTLFEYTFRETTRNSEPIPLSSNVLLFVGGMFDNYLAVPYVSELASALAPGKSSVSNWTLMHVQLSSSGTQFGISNLDKDVEQIAMAVGFIRTYVNKSLAGEPDANVVLMGHSTGCQDVMHYLLSPVAPDQRRLPVQGGILQAPASDRESFLATLESSEDARQAYNELSKQIETISSFQHDKTILPLHQTRLFFGPVPMSVSRFMSLTSPGSPAHPEQDDLFSSDLPDKRLRETFGRIAQSPILDVAKLTCDPSILVLISGADEYMPPSIDKANMLKRWSEASKNGHTASVDPRSTVLSAATHSFLGDDNVAKSARKQLVALVHGYLDTLVKDHVERPPTTGVAGATQRLHEFAIHSKETKDGKL